MLPTIPGHFHVTNEEKAVCVSACGNFGLAGTSGGRIEMWNMQSGLRRKSYELPKAIKHKGPAVMNVTGLATDALNRLVIASTLDGTINVRI